MAGSDGAEYFLSCYLTPPGEISVLSARHDHCVALWKRDGRRVDLVRMWEVERISGQKHHAWPLYTPERTVDFLDSLLAPEGLSLSDIKAVWGTPGLPGHADITLPAGAGEFPVHSLAHLYGGLLADTEIFRNETVLALAVDGAPDTVLDSRSPNHWYAGLACPAAVRWPSPPSSPRARCTPRPRRGSASNPVR